MKHGEIMNIFEKLGIDKNTVAKLKKSLSESHEEVFIVNQTTALRRLLIECDFIEPESFENDSTNYHQEPPATNLTDEIIKDAEVYIVSVEDNHQPIRYRFICSMEGEVMIALDYGLTINPESAAIFN